ncbi:restriction endonuclease subunit S [Acinetobacter beijerinckii]|uniref:restriction endonuclease subunit S n=1 Tax=Acinetobacter beijerinckii TaxID=262668 RepID=UPI0030080CDD
MAKYQKYAEYKDSNAQWLGNVPSHWGIEYSKWLFRERNAKAALQDEMLTASQKYGVIPQKMFMELEQQKVVQVFSGHDILKKAETNDFVISMRSFQGGIEFSEYSGAVSSAYVPLEPRSDLSLSYYKYLFKSVPYIQALQTTTNLVRDGQALRYGNFIQVRIPLVPFNEAEKIGQYLDHETAKIDTLITKQEKLIGLLKEKRQAVISHAVTKGLNPSAPMKDSGLEWLGEVPEHWVIGRLKNVLSIKNGRDYKNVEIEEGGYPVYGSGGVFKRSSEYLYDGISILFGRKGTVDKPLLVSGKFWTVDTMFYSELGKNVNPEYVYFQSLGFPFDKLSTNTALPSMTQEDLLNLGFALPPVNEQIEISKFITQYLEKNHSLMEKAKQAIQLMQERRTALISAAVTGKIDVRNWQHPNQKNNNNTELSA